MNSSGGGWTTILNRVDGSQSFYMNWDSYKHGFGNLGGEFWLGLEKIYYLTRYEVNEMLFELVDWENGQEDAHYDYFSIGSEEEKYILKLVGGFTGSVGDGFTDQAGMKFSTPDKDRDVIETNCAAIAKGGWWFRSCKLANPTGLYIVGGNMSDDLSGITWYPWHGSHYSLKEVRMMIRPKE
ncbi:angiopoietin-related protein 7-like [Zophobas morio]|uniref:angiopoietin-related protein 7-like n=1 Tax=Zophobas morio TaxID=2755281 RepID=UPI003082BD16